MSKVFSVDNKFFSTVNKIVDMIWLSFLWSFCSLPLLFLIFTLMTEETSLWILLLIPFGAVTVGPSSAALYYAIVKSVRRDRSYATKCFFHGFKVNFKQGAITSVLYGIAATILFLDYFWSDSFLQLGEEIAPIMRGVFMGMGIFVLFSLVWLNPLLSRFELGIKELIKNSMILAIKNIFRTILMAGIWVGLGYCFINFFNVIVYYLIFIPFTIPALSALIRSFLIEPVFKRITGDPNEDSDKEEVDAWYAE